MDRNFLTLAAAGAIITTIGSLLALFIKEYVLARHFEKRKEQKAVDTVYKKYKDPITLSGMELASRLLEIHRDYPTVYLSADVLHLKPVSFTKNDVNDEHYRKYKLYSTVYRLCAFFGWLELYRQEITFLNGSNSETNQRLQASLRNLRLLFADGHLNQEPDWPLWKDYLIFRDEQRAIGECMIVTANNQKSVVGFARFKEWLEAYVQSGENEWLSPALNFFLNPATEKDFRYRRYGSLLAEFRLLLESLDGEQAAQTIGELRQYETEKKSRPKNVEKAPA